MTEEPSHHIPGDLLEASEGHVPGSSKSAVRKRKRKQLELEQQLEGGGGGGVVTGIRSEIGDHVVDPVIPPPRRREDNVRGGNVTKSLERSLDKILQEVIINPFWLLLNLLSPIASYLLSIGIIILFGWYLLTILRSTVFYYLLPSSFPNFHLPHFDFLSSLKIPTPSLSLTPLTAIYCTTIGIGCGKTKREERIKREREVGNAARGVREQAEGAMDIFQSVVAIGREGGMDLHHVE